MSNPKISIIMPAYNAEKYIGYAIDSILNQSFKDFEFIIIDDCSTDKTAEIIKSYGDLRIRYIKNEKNLNHPACRNIALNLARGEYVAELDADDIALPNRLKLQYDFLKNSSPVIALMGGWVEVIDKDGNKTGIKKPEQNVDLLRYKFLIKNPIVHSSIFYRKDTIKKLGGYNLNYLHCEDYELYYRILKKGYLIGNIPVEVVKYREHESISTISVSRNIQLNNNYKLLHEWFNQYLPISYENTKRIVDTFHKRNTSLLSIFSTIKFSKKLTKLFLSKEVYCSTDMASEDYWEQIRNDVWGIQLATTKDLIKNCFKHIINPFLPTR